MTPDRDLVTQLLRLDRYVDMIIPRGGASLHRLCREQATVPVITGGMGICHIFVDASADLARAVDIVENAKVQRPSVCNALDTLLVHRAVAPAFLPQVAARLALSMVELRAEPEALALLPAGDAELAVKPAGPDDFDTEWMSLVLGVKVVSGLDEAIEHIQEHSTEHSDSILTNDWTNANRFVRRGQLVGGVRQRQHPLHRRRPVRAGRGGCRQHAEASRPGTDGAGRADDLQVDRHRRRATSASRRGGRLFDEYGGSAAEALASPANESCRPFDDGNPTGHDDQQIECDPQQIGSPRALADKISLEEQQIEHVRRRLGADEQAQEDAEGSDQDRPVVRGARESERGAAQRRERISSQSRPAFRVRLGGYISGRLRPILPVLI